MTPPAAEERERLAALVRLDKSAPFLSSTAACAHGHVFLSAPPCAVAVINTSRDSEGFMLLHLAAFFGHLPLSRSLITMGSKVDLMVRDDARDKEVRL